MANKTITELISEKRSECKGCLSIHKAQEAFKIWLLQKRDEGQVIEVNTFISKLIEELK